MDKIKVVTLFLHDPLEEVHLQKDPYQIPYAFIRKGFKSFLLVQDISKDSLQRITGSTQRPNIFLISGAFPLQKVHYLKKSLRITVLRVINDIMLSIKILFHLRRIKPNVVISYYYPTILFMARMAIAVKLLPPYIKLWCKLDSPGPAESSSKVIDLIRKLLMTFVYIASDVISVESYVGYRRFLAYLPLIYNKFTVLPNGISVELMTKLKELEGKSKKEKTILCVARVERYKGLELLIEAFSAIAEIFPEYKLKIIGPIVDEKYFHELLTLAYARRVQNSVFFLGSVPLEMLVKEYSSASIFVLPSVIEGFGIARLEAAAAGLPVVTTNTPGSEFFPEKLVIDRDPKKLSSLLRELIEDEQLRISFGNLCKIIASNFTWDKLTDKMLSILKIRANEVANNNYE
ncbi:glycosyltransferase family 4 protein [Thermofilum sp.]|uniref:glycosyltransferase family 4 protein n=1 Tax=Thermofilum sp. TaxID=1961369 RepID=UPI00319E6D7D